jgi:hypothetical protein
MDARLITEFDADGRKWGKSSHSGNGGNCIQVTVC